MRDGQNIDQLDLRYIFRIYVRLNVCYACYDIENGTERSDGMQTQVAKMVYGNSYSVVYDDKAEMNPYKIFRVWNENGRQVRSLVTRYDNLPECMAKLAAIAEREKPDQGSGQD